jgi:hypothetical protein
MGFKIGVERLSGWRVGKTTLPQLECTFVRNKHTPVGMYLGPRRVHSPLPYQNQEIVCFAAPNPQPSTFNSQPSTQKNKHTPVGMYLVPARRGHWTLEGCHGALVSDLASDDRPR